ncbi:MAG: NYN domain-containing protein [Negativicutes bacterium]|nr:NYN domain-containing protein [Negativicutes bacterium]
MTDRIIVDGYNVVNAWPELSALKEQDLQHARDALSDILAGYGAFKNMKVTLVFDAHLIAGSNHTEIVSPHLEVVYTNEGETADSFIEKMVYSLVRQGERVYVVTSDWAEQLAVLSFGACRISAREFRQEVQAVNKLIREGYAETALTYRRQELASRLDKKVLERLDKIRRGG